MNISQLPELNLNGQPVWTSLSRLTWRQKLALHWPYTRERGKEVRRDGLVLLAVLVFLGGFILRGLTPTGQNDTLFSFVLTGWLLISVGPVLLVHLLAQTTLRQMCCDPRFRFNSLLYEARSFDLAVLYFQYVHRDDEAEWTPALSARVNEWLEDRWVADVETHYGGVSDGIHPVPLMRRWEAMQECVESFGALRLPLPVGFNEACEERLAALRDEYIQSREDELAMRRDRLHADRVEVAALECEVVALWATQPLVTFNRGVDAH